MKNTFLCILVSALLVCQSCELFLAEEPLGSIYAIYVGLNYHGTDVNYLGGTLNDAEELELCFASLSNKHHRPYTAYLLLQKGGVVIDDTKPRYTYAYDDASLKDLLPTKSNVLAQIRALASVLTENDLTIFSFSGHGIKTGSLVLASPDHSDPTIYDEDKNLKQEALLGVTELLDALSALPGRQLLILDSCYCGSFVEDSGSSVSLIEKSRFLDKAFDIYFSSNKYDPSVYVLAATTSDNTSKEMLPSAPHIHGFFTEALLEGLGWDHGSNTLLGSSPTMKKGVLTIDSLYGYILENQKFPSKGLFSSLYQHPTISGGAYSLRIF